MASNPKGGGGDWRHLKEVVRGPTGKLIHDELWKLWNKHGYLSVQLVKEAASKPGSFFHKRLLWSDKEAADKYRTTQLRATIRLPHLRLPGSKEYVQAFQSLVDEAGDGIVVHTVTALGSKFYGEQLITRSTILANGWAERLKRYEELRKLVLSWHGNIPK